MSIVNYMNKLPVLMLQNTPYKQRINYQTLFVVLNMPAYRTMRTEAKHQDNKLPINSKVLCICFFCCCCRLVYRTLCCQFLWIVHFLLPFMVFSKVYDREIAEIEISSHDMFLE
jgi:hypothetical protein